MRRETGIRSSVLVVRGLVWSSRAGVPGCLAERRVLAGIDLTLHVGERVGVSGAPGAGKTVLLLLLAGALRPHAGVVLARAGGELALSRTTRLRAAASVAEPMAACRSVCESEVLRWPRRVETSLTVARRQADLPARLDRVFTLRDGRLWPDETRARVASVLGRS